MNEEGHRGLMASWASIISRQEWDRLDDVLAPGALVEYPQSGERFRGIDNIRAQYANYPDVERVATDLTDVVGGSTYAMTPLFTVIGVDGSGDRGVGIFRARYPDGTHWWVVNLYELDGEKIVRSRIFFAAEFEPAEWRARYWDKS